MWQSKMAALVLVAASAAGLGLARAADGDQGAVEGLAEDRGADGFAAGAAPSWVEPGLDTGAPGRCWTGLKALASGTESFADMKRAIEAAFLTGDERLLQFLTERLGEMLRADPSLANAVLDWARASQEHGVIAAYAAAIADSGAANRADVRSQLLAMAADSADLEHQGAALAMLEGASSLNAGEIDSIVAAGRSVHQDFNSQLAMRTLGVVMERDCAQGCAEYVDGILDIAEGVPDPDAQRFAAELMTMVPDALPPRAVSALSLQLSESPDAWTRQMASLALASNGATDDVLAIFRDAFARETDFCTRVALFRDAAAAGGPEALPLMKEFAQAEPELLDDYQLFVRVYESGVVAFDQVVHELFDQIHLECAAHTEGE